MLLKVCCLCLSLYYLYKNMKSMGNVSLRISCTLITSESEIFSPRQTMKQLCAVLFFAKASNIARIIFDTTEDIDMQLCSYMQKYCSVSL